MTSDCNNTTPKPLCGTCTSTPITTCGGGCLDTYDTSCIQYDGVNLSCLGVNTGAFLNDVLCTLNNDLCLLQANSGLVKVDETDDNPGTLIDKLVAGANIILTGIGTGDSKQIRIDAVDGGVIIDQMVKASATDQTSGFLDAKLAAGECIIIQKVNPGLNEKLQLSIDWNCVFNKLSALPQFCNTIVNCIPAAPTSTCPSILLVNPSISGSVATVSWASSGTSFNVYIDGVIQPGMPTASLTYTTSALANGSHTVDVIANCNSGTPNKDTQTFLINTVCPVPNQLVATLLSGTASLNWVLDANANNISQDVQYKLSTSPTWITATSVSAITTSYNITGLNSNKIYNFRVVNNCAISGPSPSTAQTIVELTCPTVSLTAPNSATINYSFASLGGDIDNYTVELFDSAGTTLIQSKNQPGPFGATISNGFSGLTGNTTYKVKVTVHATTFNKVCGIQTITTPNTPACPAVSNVTSSAS